MTDPEEIVQSEEIKPASVENTDSINIAPEVVSVEVPQEVIAESVPVSESVEESIVTESVQELVEPASTESVIEPTQIEVVPTPIQTSVEEIPKQEIVQAKPPGQLEVSSISGPSVPEPAPTISPEIKEVIKEVSVYRPTLEMMRTLQKKSLVAIQQRKLKKIEKIMTLFTKKEKITSPEVQKLLIVSHNTAGRYLDVLEQEGRIKQIGKRGGSVYYVRI